VEQGNFHGRIEAFSMGEHLSRTPLGSGNESNRIQSLMTAKEQIVELKCIAPKIEFHIEEITERASAEFYYKRLIQLAKKAKDKYQDIVDAKSDVL
jgi:hypothetical protein